MFGRLKDMLTRKEVIADEKNAEFEKGDFLALLIAAASFMFPVLIFVFLFFALIVWIIF